METNAPSKLKSKLRFYPINQIGETTWGILKAKLTGKKSKFGHFYSEVNLSESDVDKLIENIKKSGEYPNLEDESDDNLEIYQNWLVDTYLKSASTEYKSDGDKEKKNESVKVESKKDSAPPLYEGVRETDLVDEEIDERILEILGLEEVYDFTYGEYKQLLFTELQKIDRGEEKSVDRAILLQDEFKRIKGKVGKFKLKKKKITAESIGTTGPIQISRDKFFVTSRAIVPTTPTSIQESSKDITDIEKALDDILKSLTLQNKEKKKRTDEERKKSEDRKRRQREGDLEKPLSQLKALAKKIIAPAQRILDRIFRFIKFTLLGYAFNQLVKWFSDPKNADKVKVLGRFLSDWWPALLSAYVLFATPFGKFIRVTLKLLRGLIPQMVKFIAKHPFAFAGVTAALAVGGAEMWRQQKEKGQIEKESQKRNVKPEVVQREVTEAKSSPLGMIGETFSKIGPLGMFNTGGLVRRKSFFGGGEIQKELDINQIAFAEGGGVDDSSGVRIKGAGPDTQLIAAAPGEVVMSKKAVDKYGANFFLDLNKKAGGTNIPKIANNIQLAAGGGLIKRTIKSFQGGGMVGGNRSSIPSTSGGGSGFNPMRGFMNWWNRGRNVRVPNENTAKFGGLKQYIKKNPNPKTLFGDDALQITRGNKAFQSGATGYSGWNPFKAFTPNMVKTGPTPAIRQAVERPLKSFSSAPKVLKGIGGGVGSILMDMAFPEPAFNPTLDDARRMGFPMGPQSKAMPPGPPTIISKTTFTVLPPIKVPSKSQSVPKTSELPSFNISANSDSRSNIAISLGIRDLVGV